MFSVCDGGVYTMKQQDTAAATISRRETTGIATVVRASAASMMAIVLIASAAGVSPASADTLSGPDVVWYVALDALPTGTQTIVVQGAATPDGGCAFDLEGSGGAPDATQTGQEIAYNPVTCQSLIAENLPEEPDLTPSEGTQAQSDSGSVTGSSSSSARYHTESLHSWFEDSPGIHVNDVTNYVWYYADGTCLVINATQGYDLRWLWETSWYLAASNWNHSLTWCPPGSHVTSSSYAHFANILFCAIIFDTDTYFNRNVAKGYGNGGYSFSVHWEKSGPCSPLLSFHYQNSHT